MYSASKIGSLVKKLGFNKSKHSSYCNYNRLEEEAAAKDNGIPARRGYVAMYVGKEGKRYEVPLKFLSSPTLQQLLLRSQDDDLEPKIDGPITVDCTPDSFDQILKLLKHHHHHH